MMIGKWLSSSIGILAALALSGCATTTHHGIRPLRPLELATAPYLDRAVQAHVGSLMYEGGCLLFREERTRAHFLPVWPTGTVFNGTSVIFHQPAKDEQRIVVGEELLIEGQGAQWQALPPSAFQPFRHQCASPPFYVSRVRPAD